MFINTAQAVIGLYRLPPNMHVEVMDQPDYQTLVIKVVGNFPNVYDPKEMIETYRSMSLAYIQLDRDPVFMIKYMIEGLVRDLWDHELKEWFTFEGKHIQDPHPL